MNELITTPRKVWGMDIPTYLTILHLSQLANFLIPFAGVVIPIVMWAVNKNEDSKIDMHGRIVINWILSSLIYGFIFFILVFLIIGIPLLIGLGLATVAFSIIGGLKAYKGETWRYPLSFRFLSLENLSLPNTNQG